VEGEEGRGWEVSGVGNPANSTHASRVNSVSGIQRKVTHMALSAMEELSCHLFIATKGCP